MRALWRSINVAQPIDSGTMRLSCAVFFAIYAIIVVSRAHESHVHFLVPRLVVCLYALFGVWLSRWPTARNLRAYTVGLAFVLPLQAAYVDGILGNGIGEVAISAIATFVPLAFLQTAVDFVVVDVGLVIGHAVVLLIVPEPQLPLLAIAVMVGGAMATGTVAGLQTLVYRARWAESVADLEEALASTAEWKNRFEAASLASRQLLYDWDPRSDEVRWGGAYDRILGYALDELCGGLARWQELIHPGDRGDFAIETARALETKSPLHLQYRVRRKDGRYVVVEHDGYFVLAPDGAIVRSIGFVSDVTGRATAEKARADEAAISAALARVGRELISSLETPVVLERLCRLTTEVLECDFSQTWVRNRDAGEYTPTSCYGLTTEEWEALRLVKLPSDPEAPAMSRLLREEIVQVTRTSTEYPLIGGVLSYYGFTVVLCAPLYRGGELVGIQTAGSRTRSEPFTPAQERIARGIAQLASMAWTNAQLVEELERASRLKSEFVSTMSHELRTPLNVILGYTDMLADTALEREQATLLARIRRSSVELLELIEATLDLNRIGVRQEPAPPRAVGARELLGRAPDGVRGAAGEGGRRAPLRRRRRCAPHRPPQAQDDPQEPDRRTRSSSRPRAASWSRCARTDAGCVFTVTDTGIGIPEPHLPYIFDMFRQVDSSDARSYGGVGLGLYIVRQLVEQLGGEIGVESEPGRGSVFRVTVPEGPVPQAAAA